MPDHRCAVSLLGASTLAAQDSPTFFKDVLRILQANCQEPVAAGRRFADPLLTYEQSRPWAGLCEAAVATRQDAAMVPGPERLGHFANRRKIQ